MYECTKALINCCYNIENGNIKLSKAQQKRLRRYRNQMKMMINPKIRLKNKNRIINQRGGFLGTLLGVALPAITSLVSSLINKPKK